MYADVMIKSKVAGDALLVPSEAVIRTGTRNIVIVALGEGKFLPKEVVLGPEGQGVIQVKSGLSEGDTVVTSGQFLIDSESNLREAVSKMMEAQKPAESPKQARPEVPAAKPAASAPSGENVPKMELPLNKDQKALMMKMTDAYVLMQKALVAESLAGVRAQARIMKDLVGRLKASDQGRELKIDHRACREVPGRAVKRRHRKGEGFLCAAEPDNGGLHKRRRQERGTFFRDQNILLPDEERALAAEGQESCEPLSRQEYALLRQRGEILMIERIIEFSVRNRFLIILATFFILIWGIYSLANTPLDAIPDLSDVQVIVYTEYPGQAPQVVEDQITYPLTTAMLAVPGSKVVRGYSFFGFSFVYIIFEDGTDLYWARSRVLEYLNYVSGRLPKGVTPSLGPDATGVGWVYEYALVDRSGTA